MQETILKENPVSSSDRPQSLGKLTSFEINDKGLEGTTTYGKFKVIFYNDSVIRIWIAKEEFEEDFSYSVIQKPDSSKIMTEEINGELVVSGQELVLKIKKDPVRFTFLDMKGNVICEDDKSFGTCWQGDQVTTYKKLQPEERFIGLGEKTGPLDRKGEGYQNWNTDNFGYPVNADPLYSSIPFYIGIHSNLQYGIFFDNTFKSFFNFGASNNRVSSFSADSGEMNYYFVGGKNVKEIITNYTWLTGRMELPPLWSLGYQQCRYSYRSETEVLRVAEAFRLKDIPADAIVLDIHHMDNYKIFTWNPKAFSNPDQLVKKLKQDGFDTVVICDPGIKVDRDYEPYNKGIEKDIFIKYPDGTLFEAQVWPGWCHFPDFSNSECRDTWMEMLEHYTKSGIKGFWNDMNEIASWGQMMPELIQFDFEGRKASLRRMKNVYGLLMAMTTYQAAKTQLKGDRPFNLSRSGYSGIQRYAALWTGDNVASDQHMMLGVRMVNSLGISGVSFSGYDVGGFAGDSTPELFARWVSIGAFSPFFRGHSVINSRSAEPWTFGERVLEISRNFIKLRYRLLPYIYSSVYESTVVGIPLCRSLAIEYSHDPQIYNPDFDCQYLFGPNLLIAPAPSTNNYTKVYLPVGEWYDIYTDTPYKGGSSIVVESPVEKLPIFVKASGILIMQSPVSSTKESCDGVMEVHLYKGNDESEFLYFEDDGNSYGYKDGSFAKRNFKVNPNGLSIENTEGSYESKFKSIRLYLHGFESLKEARVNKKITNILQQDYRFIEPVSCFDPIHCPGNFQMTIENLPYIEFPYSRNGIDVQLIK